ncbi:hypothetical protein [Devosia chinhatensis]|uniref:Uncharacterized protein n=1 Tax=Devosia chinhatensis TaxID=429727 RepID=A0A0F5FKD3_9HYPH|nr:hypothetical protein [Devosia chinhatensis]KKB08667.1 hypothetical protein VE26_00820 [Devosia chinhatensis]
MPHRSSASCFNKIDHVTSWQGLDRGDEKLFVGGMDGDRLSLETLRPLWPATLALIVFLVMAGIAFSQADNVSIPPAPQTLVLERIRIDAVRHTLEPAGPSGPQLRTSVPVRFATSEDWPGLAFRFSGAAAAISIIPPVVFDLYLASSLQEQAERHRRWPNVYPVLEAYGVVQDDRILLDPEEAYAAKTEQKRRSTLLGYGCLAAALLSLVLLVQRARRLWRQIAG